MTPRDVHSFARPEEARVTHLSLDAVLEFGARRLRGRASLDLEVAPGAGSVVLDTRGLHILSVSDASGAPLPFHLGDAHPVLGQALVVELRAGVERIAVEYTTGERCDGLLWLAPEQTAGGAQPFVFSQGHAILTRSWIPTQDSLSVRQSFDATITVPEPLTAVMSAEHLTPKGEQTGAGRRFRFRMREPIPPYLIALAAGDLAFRSVGPRTGVFAERLLVERAADEFGDLERMLEAAESIAGPYRWGRADVLVLPPSFPFGGMENPRLTFVSPTLLAGDRSLTTVVAHELAHAWSGNLVTPATWSDFWLNEGLTVYLELRINEALHGAERAQMLEVYGHRELTAAIARLGADSPDTRLHLDLDGRDPADAVTVIPYLKGAAFLRVLEGAVGRDRLTDFLRGWFERHAFASVDSATLVREVREHLLRGDAELEARIGVSEWVHGAGLPVNAVVPISARLARVDEAAQRFAEGAPAETLPAEQWTPQEWRHFLGALPGELPPERLRELDDVFRLSEAANSEVLFAWLRLASASRFAPALPALERFLLSTGRGKFVRPLYAALAATEWGADEARRIYRAARPRYHALVSAAVDPLLP